MSSYYRDEFMVEHTSNVPVVSTTNHKFSSIIDTLEVHKESAIFEVGVGYGESLKVLWILNSVSVSSLE